MSVDTGKLLHLSSTSSASATLPPTPISNLQAWGTQECGIAHEELSIEQLNKEIPPALKSMWNNKQALYFIFAGFIPRIVIRNQSLIGVWILC